MSCDKWLVGRPNPDAVLRLFCFSYAGGGASTFMNWHAGLPANVEVVAIQLPGRESRFTEEPISDLTTVIDQIVKAITPRLDKPFVFFGHSLGGLLAYETAWRLSKLGLDVPRWIIVSGKRAPHMPPRRRAISQLPDSEFIREIAMYDGTPPTLLENAEFVEMILPKLRADASLFDNYTYTRSAILPVPITAFGGDYDPHVNQEELLGWKELAVLFDFRVFPGGHFFIKFEEPAVLREVSAILAGVASATESLRGSGKLAFG